MKCVVTVTCKLAKGYTAKTAEVDEMTLGEHEYKFEGEICCLAGAREKALNAFHAQHGIGVLDGVEITTEIKTEVKILEISVDPIGRVKINGQYPDVAEIKAWAAGAGFKMLMLSAISRGELIEVKLHAP